MTSILSASATRCSGILSVVVQDSFTSPTSTAQITCTGSSLELGDSVTVVMGYQGDTFTAFTGYVKEIELKEPEMFYTISCANVMIRAVDFFIASSTPTTPFTWSNISAEDLIEAILRLAGLTSFDMEATSFTFAVHNPVEVNLTGAYDYAHFLADIIAFNLYADNVGTVHLINRRPYPVGGDTSVATIDSGDGTILSADYAISDRDLRNKIIVYGTGDIHAEASAVSPYLPAGYYRTVVVAAPGVIDTSGMASQAASYNLNLLNKLTYRLSLTILGQTGLEARTVVTVNLPELGLINEKFFVFAVEHNLSRNGYITNLELHK